MCSYIGNVPPPLFIHGEGISVILIWRGSGKCEQGDTNKKEERILKVEFKRVNYMHKKHKISGRWKHGFRNIYVFIYVFVMWL